MSPRPKSKTTTTRSRKPVAKTAMPFTAKPVPEIAETQPVAKEAAPVSSQSRRRRERQPLGTARMKLSLSDKAKQYFRDNQEVPRWINDDPGRLEAASQEDSYRFVEQRELADTLPIGQGVQVSEQKGLGSKVSRIVGTRGDGSPVTAYLMAKPLEDYEEDQRTKRSAIDKKEAAMKKGMTEPVENMYIPSTGIKIIGPGG